LGAVYLGLRDKLTDAFQPIRLEITDDSDRHAGHAGAREGGESHFTVLIEAAAFAGQPKVARQRMVYRVLADELAGPVHALSLKALAPGEG
jgi:BolA family transcriptional regulator, general stress-responsive regulator